MKPSYGKKTTIVGIARDAKAGAVIIVNNEPVYIQGLESWPGRFSGKKVKATGVLREKKHIPDPVNANGEITQGAWGKQDVLEDAKWELVE